MLNEHGIQISSMDMNDPPFSTVVNYLNIQGKMTGIFQEYVNVGQLQVQDDESKEQGSSRSHGILTGIFGCRLFCSGKNSTKIQQKSCFFALVLF